MRKTLSNYLNILQDNNIFLLHGDTWHFPTYNSINCGIIEPTIVSIAAGLASQGKNVIIYGVCGFILYRAFDQIKFYISKRKYNGSVIFINAGANRCYDKKLGQAHQIDDDFKLCEILKIDHFEPQNKNDFLLLIKNKLKHSSISFIRLGFDE